MGTVLKVMLGILLAGVVLIAGCAALLGAGVEEVQEESDRTAITFGQYEQVKVGDTTRAKIEGAYGPPQSAQDLEAAAAEGIPESRFRQECLYYGKRGELAGVYQFCVDERGIVRSKASY